MIIYPSILPFTVIVRKASITAYNNDPGTKSQSPSTVLLLKIPTAAIGRIFFIGNRRIRFINPEFADIPHIFLDFPIDLGKFKPIRAVSSVPLFGGSDTPILHLC